VVFIGVAKITLDFYGNDRIEKKASEIRKLIKLVTQKFTLDFAEVEEFADPEKCVLAYCLCGPDERKLKKRMETISGFIDKNSFARVVADDREYFRCE
jgi:uncharacterized protein YlxP (DUF503 family)